MIRKLAASLAIVAAVSLSASAQDSSVKLGDFKAGLDGWDFYNGKEFPGAEGNLWHDESKKAVILEGAFAGGGAYVAMTKVFEDPIDLKAVYIKIASDDIKVFGFRITDSTGQTFQHRVAIPAPGKGAATIRNFATGKNIISWGGEKDGKWHGPAKNISILLDKGNLADPENIPKGQLRVESVDGSL